MIVWKRKTKKRSSAFMLILPEKMSYLWRAPKLWVHYFKEWLFKAAPKMYSGSKPGDWVGYRFLWCYFTTCQIPKNKQT